MSGWTSLCVVGLTVVPWQNSLPGGDESVSCVAGVANSLTSPHLGSTLATNPAAAWALINLEPPASTTPTSRAYLPSLNPPSCLLPSTRTLPFSPFCHLRFPPTFPLLRCAYFLGPTFIYPLPALLPVSTFSHVTHTSFSPFLSFSFSRPPLNRLASFPLSPSIPLSHLHAFATLSTFPPVWSHLSSLASISSERLYLHLLTICRHLWTIFEDIICSQFVDNL